MNRAIELHRGGGEPSHVLLPVPNGPMSEDTDRLNLQSFWSILRRRRKLMLIVLATVFALAVLVTIRTKPTYTAVSEVALNSATPQVAPTVDNASTDSAPTPNDALADTEVQVLSSRALATRVAGALNLYADPRMNPSADKRLGMRGRILKSLGLWSESKAAPDPNDIRNAVLDTLQNAITITRVGTSYAMMISAGSPDPKLSAAIANEFARQYTLDQTTTKASESEAAKAFLAKRLEDVRQQASADTAAVQRYRIANNLPSTTGSSLTEQEISSYNQEVTQARAQAAEDSARLNTARAQLKAGSSGQDVGAALDSPVISSLRTQQAQISSQLADLKSRFGDRYPDVVKMKSQLADVEASIQAETNRVISNLEQKSRVSDQRLDSLAGSLGGARSALVQNNKAMIALDDYTRRAEASQQLYDSYLNRYKEISASAGGEHPDARILSLAEAPLFPSSPNIVLNIALALVIGGGLGVGAAIFAELAYSGLTTGAEVETRLHVPYLASVPSVGSVIKGSKDPLTAVVEHPQSAFAETFRNLRTSIDYSAAGRVQVVTVTSALPQEGKTTTAICLARVTAMSGERVLLIDCDARKRTVSRSLAADPSRPGLREVLRGVAKLDEAIVADPLSNADILFLGDGGQEVGELLTGVEMDRLLEDARTRFSYIILDAPPVLPIADARILAAKSDATVLIARWRKTPDHAIKSAIRLLPPAYVRLAGVALSRVNMHKQVRFGYGDSSFYFKDYKDYYG